MHPFLKVISANGKSRCHPTSWSRPVTATAITVLLAACGGDGDGDSGGGTNPPTPGEETILSQFFVESFAAFDSAAQSLIQTDQRYLFQQIEWFFSDMDGAPLEPTYNTYPLQSSGAHYAHAAGLTGEGQIIAIVDDGFLIDHEAFDGKTIQTPGPLPVEDHGTQVASVAAGNSDQMIGIAPGADLVFGKFGDPGPEPGSIVTSYSSLVAATNLAETVGAVAQNNSWGFVDAPVSQAMFNSVFSGADAQAYLAALLSYTETGVVIFAVSNEFNDASASIMPALPSLESDLQDGWLAVINAEAEMSGDDVIGATRISAACLQAAQWCLAAEGAWDGASSAGVDSYALAAGSSFAAPMVAGAMALLAEAFPEMTPHDLRIRLLASADNTFDGFDAAGSIELVTGFVRDYSEEWGHGFLDIKAALLPIGAATASLADGSSYDISEPLVVVGGASGDAVARALRGVSLAVDDALGAQFAVPADALVAQRPDRPLTEAIYTDWQNGGEGDCCAVASYLPTTRVISTAMDATELRFMIPQEGDQDPSYGVSLSHGMATANGEFSFSLMVGHDGGDLLPQWYSGGGGSIVAGTMEMETPLGDSASLQLTAGFGGTLGGSSGPDSGASFNSASASIVSRDVFSSDDRFSVSVGLPVAVSSGQAEVTLPVMTLSGVAEHRAIDVDLAPENREVHIGFSYLMPLSDGSDVVLSAMHAENFGSIAGQSSTGAFIGFRARF